MSDNELKQKFGVAISENYRWEFSQEENKAILIDIRNGDKIETNTYEAKILVYEDRVNGWFLNVAERLKSDNEAGFIILQIASSYIEGNQQFRDGSSSRGNSENVFVKAMKRIFDLNGEFDGFIIDFYKQVRCGLFHNSITGDKVKISAHDKMDTLKMNGFVIHINPHKFLSKIKEDFNNYISDLRNSKSPEKENFEKMFKIN